MSAIQNFTNVFFGDKKRQYHVYGEIIFKFRFSDDRSSSPEMRKQMLLVIREVDELHPWKDFDLEGKSLPSISIARFSGDQFNNWSVPELNVWFRIEPTARYMHKGQIHAYEKYLETLAQQLAERPEFVGMATARSMCHFSKSSIEFRG